MTEMDFKVKQLEKLLNKLVVPKYNSVFNELGLENAIDKIEVSVNKWDKTYYDDEYDEEFPIFNLKVYGINKILFHPNFTDGQHALYHFIANTSEYVDPTRRVVFVIRILLNGDLKISDTLYPYMGKYPDENADIDLAQNIVRIISDDQNDK
jgi:hypothetical protein